MKRIAVACEGEQVAQHFGHCANFMFFDTEGEAIIKFAAFVMMLMFVTNSTV